MLVRRSPKSATIGSQRSCSMPAERPSFPVITRSTERLPLSTWGLIVPTRSGAPALSQVTAEMMSGCSATKASTITPVSFWLPATSRMFRVTGADGVSGTPDPAGSPSAPAPGVSGASSVAGGLHAVRSIPTAAIPATRCRGLELLIGVLLSGLVPGLRLLRRWGCWSCGCCSRGLGSHGSGGLANDEPERQVVVVGRRTRRIAHEAEQHVDGGSPAVRQRDADARQRRRPSGGRAPASVSYTHLRAHETDSYLVC